VFTTFYVFKINLDVSRYPIPMHGKCIINYKSFFQLSFAYFKSYACKNSKVKVKVPCNRPRRAERRDRGIAVLILDHSAGRGWVVSTTPRPLYPQERPGIHFTEDWVGPEPVWTCAKNFAPHRDLIPGQSSL
jgi:hypothetical protein